MVDTDTHGPKNVDYTIELFAFFLLLLLLLDLLVLSGPLSTLSLFLFFSVGTLIPLEGEVGEGCSQEPVPSHWIDFVLSILKKDRREGSLEIIWSSVT